MKSSANNPKLGGKQMAAKNTSSIFSAFILLFFLCFTPTYTFSAKPIGPELTVAVEGEGSVEPSGGVYKKNNMVTLTATAATNWVFDHWEGDLTTTANPTTIRMTSDKHVVAVFVEKGTVEEYTLTTAVYGQGSITPPGGDYVPWSNVEVTATPSEGWVFDSWSGNLSGNINPATITMDENMHVIANFTEEGSPPLLDKEVVGYFTQWGVYRRNYHVKNIAASGSANTLTAINYAFAGIGDDLTCQSLDPYADYNKRYDADESVDGIADTVSQPLKGSFNQLKKLKTMYPHLRVLISIGGWNDSDKFSDAALPENRVKFVSSCLDMFINGNFDPESGIVDPTVFDGIDIDWEYPGACGATCNFREADTKNFTALLQEFRTQLDNIDPQLLLTIAAPAGNEYYAKIELGLIYQYLDWINLMTYDFHGSWEPHGPTNHHANLYLTNADPSNFPMSVNTSVTGYLGSGVPPAKINIGLPFYGRGWASVSSTNDGLYQPAGRIPRGKWEKGVEDYKILKNAGFQSHWDGEAQAAWLYNGNEFWTYDNQDSIDAKMSYIKVNGLGGVMFWELSGDDTSGTLINAIDQGLQ